MPATRGNQSSTVLMAQTLAAANGNGVDVDVDGYKGAVIMEVVESNGGTATLTLSGSLDRRTFLGGVGYQQIDATNAPTRATGAISITANMWHRYLVLDDIALLRAALSSVSSAVVTVRFYCVP